MDGVVIWYVSTLMLAIDNPRMPNWLEVCCELYATRLYATRLGPQVYTRLGVYDDLKLGAQDHIVTRDNCCMILH